eukprot:6208562-Pleurochrysis_carterae.AAC.3
MQCAFAWTCAVQEVQKPLQNKSGGDMKGCGLDATSDTLPMVGLWSIRLQRTPAPCVRQLQEDPTQVDGYSRVRAIQQCGGMPLQQWMIDARAAATGASHSM